MWLSSSLNLQKASIGTRENLQETEESEFSCRREYTGVYHLKETEESMGIIYLQEIVNVDILVALPSKFMGFPDG